MDAEKEIKIKKFINENCFACGGDWTSMLLSGIKNGMPNVYAKMPDKEYTMAELFHIIETNLE